MLLPMVQQPTPATAFNAAPYARVLQSGALQWDDPREIHRVVVRFKGAAPEAAKVHIDYWSSRWPEQRLPKDRQPGGGDVGWWELGNWYTGEWRRADTDATMGNNALSFTFRPIDAKERPDLKGFHATYRYTLKLRAVVDGGGPEIAGIEAYTDSRWAERDVRVVWRQAPTGQPAFEAFNGRVVNSERQDANSAAVRLLIAENADPNTFDRTLLTVKGQDRTFTVALDDLRDGPLFAPALGIVVLPADDTRDYAAVERDVRAKGGKTLYDRVSELPEQTWQAAWAGVPPKKSRIYYPLGLDGGRQRFRLDADGGVLLRTNDHYLRARPGRDTPLLAREAGPVAFRFGLPGEPDDRVLLEGCLPIVTSRWNTRGLEVNQVALVTSLSGAHSLAPPPGDEHTVFLARFVFKNVSRESRDAGLILKRASEDNRGALTAGDGGQVVDGKFVRAAVSAPGAGPLQDGKGLAWRRALKPGETWTVDVKLPYLPLDAAEAEQLAALDFRQEHAAMAAYWRKRLDESARLITPVPTLNAYYRSQAMHLLVNCEREPAAERRFARVGSFGYGAYGNESCMMVADLLRRGYFREARECLDGWLKYQGTVALPGDFDSQEGVLYGAGGYEAGGYNQHHGWILWAMAEYYRFTHDDAWLARARPGILAACDWIVRERKRTAGRDDLARGLLPAGSLEDIQDWWPWLSTNCYTWRGLDSAVWVLAQARFPEAGRLQREADDYRQAILTAFRSASERSPLVRLRDGTAVPHIPSHPFRRGRCFGWICETLEGALHLLITGLLDPHSEEAGWIVRDYEDNLFLSNQYGYILPDFEKQWFGLGGMSMQACLLLDVDAYLARGDVKQALRSCFNAIAVGYFPDVQMLTEHALPNPGDWRGDHFKSSDEANAAGWLRMLFVREEGDTLLLGEAVPRDWLKPGMKCGTERAATPFGPVSVVYDAAKDRITATVDAPRRNPPHEIRLRFRDPAGRSPSSVTVNGKAVGVTDGEWVILRGPLGHAVVEARYLGTGG